MANIDVIRAKIEHGRRQVDRQRGEIKRLQRGWIPCSSAEDLLERMLNEIDDLCAERDRLKGQQPAPGQGSASGGRRW